MSLTVHINSLPDLVLRRIFSKVPLNDIIHGRRVCSVWKLYCTEICNQVRSLTLLIGSSSAQSLITNSCFTLKNRDLLLNDDGTRMYSSQHLEKWFHVTYGWFTLNQSAEMSNIFPHITTLEIAFKFVQGQFLLSPMVPLLAQWSPMLKSLKMYFQFNGTRYVPPPFNAKAATEILNILEVINSIQSLIHLTFDIDFSISPFWNIPPIPEIHPDSIDLPVLGHLHEFYFKSGDNIHIIEQSLKHFALPNVNLKQIGLHIATYHQNLYGRLPQLVSKIVYTASFCNIPRHLSNQFSSISSLRFPHYGHNPFNGELNLFASLPQLTYIHYISTTFGSLNFPTRTRAPLDQLRQLTSVLLLTITTSLKSTFDYESNLWAHLFPNVQVINLNIKDNYSLGFMTSPHIPSFRTKQEHQEIASTFAHCPKLHHIYTHEMIVIKSVSSYEEIEVSAFEWTVLQVCDRKIIINTKQSSNV